MSDNILRYRGRDIGPEDVQFIRQFIAQRPDLSRRRLSTQLCQAWNWVQPNGALRDMVCRGLLLALHRAGWIELPAKRIGVLNNVVAHRRRRAHDEHIDESPLVASLAELGPLSIEQVRRTQGEDLWAQLLAHHHYLGYCRPVGEHLKYLVWARQRPVACLGWSSAPRHLAPRDRYIGWSVQHRKQGLQFLAYNTRFLILPWVKVPHLASHLLGRVARQISADWQRVYEHPIYLLETFIDPARFAGTCYRAANWISLGQTSGRGHNDHTYRYDQPRKQLWVYPLSPNFRRLLTQSRD
jgi:Domain of unknown function (DUF4338)